MMSTFNNFQHFQKDFSMSTIIWNPDSYYNWLWWLWFGRLFWIFYIFCYFFFEIVQRHIQISLPNPVIFGFNIRIQITITLVIIFCPKCNGIFLIPISPLFWTGILQVKWISIKIVIWSSNISSNVNISQIFPHLHSRLKQLINV